MADLRDQMRETARPSTLGTLAYLTFGMLLWAVQLTVIYGGHTLACSQGAAPRVSDWLVYGATGVVGVVIICFLARQAPFARLFGLNDEMADRRTYDRIAWILGALSAIAIAWTGATALLVAACEQAR